MSGEFGGRWLIILLRITHSVHLHRIMLFNNDVFDRARVDIITTKTTPRVALAVSDSSTWDPDKECDTVSK